MKCKGNFMSGDFDFTRVKPYKTFWIARPRKEMGITRIKKKYLRTRTHDLWIRSCGVPIDLTTRSSGSRSCELMVQLFLQKNRVLLLRRCAQQNASRDTEKKSCCALRYVTRKAALCVQGLCSICAQVSPISFFFTWKKQRK